jgi:hypothetical protein
VDALIRRQLVMAVVAAVVVLVAVLMAAWAVPDDAGRAVMRVAPDGSRVLMTSPAESSRWAMWVTVAALAAVLGVLLMLIHHTVRVARSALAGSTPNRQMR